MSNGHRAESDLEFLELVVRYQDGALAPFELVQLEIELLEDSEKMRTFAETQVRSSTIREVLRNDAYAIGNPKVNAQRPRKRSRPAMLLATVLLFLCGLAIGWLIQRNAEGPAAATVAMFGELRNVRWVAAEGNHQPGEAIAAGQRLELSAGVVYIEFQRGAVVVLQGPAIFDVESENSGYLMLGQLTATATTDKSKGFTIQTRSARVVDLGTEFSASASSDGHSRIAVTSGEVEVHLVSVNTPHLLHEGDVIEVEPGPTQITARIERGDDTSAFHFPTIEPPSALDFADREKGRATLRCIAGRLERQSGPLEVLLDGAGQSNHDAPEESVFFANDQTGRILLDLGQKVSITKVNSYSWHRSRGNEVDRVRATQKFMLYGFDGEQAPAADGSLTEAGWVLLARVNTDEYFGATRQNRPAQQASSISGAHGTLGCYRYLLWEALPTRDQGDLNGTFYGEFDVYASPDD